MRYNATIEVGSSTYRLFLSELAGVGSRQVAERDKIVSRLYDGLLDRVEALTIGRPYWVTDENGKREVMYPAFQRGDVVRLHKRDGEFYPGVTLERLGVFEAGKPTFFTGGDDWFIASYYAQMAYQSTDLEVYEDVSELFGELLISVCLAGKSVVVGGFGKVFHSTDGTSWSEIVLPAGAEEVYGLAFTGTSVVCACVGGYYSIDWATKAITTVNNDTYRGISSAFNNALPYRVKKVGEGQFELWSPSAKWRDITLATLIWSHRFAQLTTAPSFITVRDDGHVIKVTAGALTDLGTIASEGMSGTNASAIEIRNIIVINYWGKLYWTNGTSLRQVYTFGENTIMYPSLKGPIVVTDSGLAYRVRRISYGL